MYLVWHRTTPAIQHAFLTEAAMLRWIERNTKSTRYNPTTWIVVTTGFMREAPRFPL